MDLKISNSTATKTYTLTNVAPAKPYLKVSNSFLPLTTQTTSGLKMKIQSGNTTYRPLEYKTVSKSETYYTSANVSDGLSSTTGLTRASTSGTTYLTRASTSGTTYLTRASTSGTTYYTRASTSGTTYLTRASTSNASYATRASTSGTTYLTRASTSDAKYATRVSTSGTSYGTRASTSGTTYLTRASTSGTTYLTRASTSATISSTYYTQTATMSAKEFFMLNTDYGAATNTGYVCIINIYRSSNNWSANSNYITQNKNWDFIPEGTFSSKGSYYNYMSINTNVTKYTAFGGSPNLSWIMSTSNKPFPWLASGDYNFKSVSQNASSKLYTVAYFASECKQSMNSTFTFTNSIKSYNIAVSLSVWYKAGATYVDHYETRVSTSGTNYGTRASTSNTSYGTRASTSGTTYLTRASTSAATYYTRVSTSGTSYGTRASTSNATYYTRVSTSGTSYGTRASTSNTSYGTRASTSGTNYGTRISTSDTVYGTRASTSGTNYGTRASTSAYSGVSSSSISTTTWM